MLEQDPTGPGWVFDDLGWRVLVLLNWAWEATGGVPGARAELDLEAQAVVGDADVLVDVLFQTWDQGLWAEFKLTPGSADSGFIILTAYARDLIEKIQTKRDDPRSRRPACRDALAYWLYYTPGTPSLADFSQSEFGEYYLTPFSDGERDAAARWLRARGYLDVATADPADPAGWHPHLTSAGERLVEEERSVNSPEPTSPNVTYNISGSQGVNVAHDSPAARQSAVVQTTADQREALQSLADHITQLVQNYAVLSIPEEFAERGPALAEGLQAAAKAPVADRKRLRQLLDNARELALLASAVPLGAGLLAAVEQVGHALGIG